MIIFSRVSAKVFFGAFFFARKREFIFLMFLWVFFGVFVLFGGCFCSFEVFCFCFSRVGANFFWVYFSR